MKCDYNENKGDDRSMQHTPRVKYLPLIQCEVVDAKMIGYYHMRTEEMTGQCRVFLEQAGPQSNMKK
eukprot:10677530-Ditylum_brightwellii.AAC.1